MGRFRKKPVVIEAVQYDGTVEGLDRVCAFAPGVYFDLRGARTFAVPTLEGEHIASPGDWIIRGVKGELYPCKPDIFEATYESANEPKRTFEVGDVVRVKAGPPMTIQNVCALIEGHVGVLCVFFDEDAKLHRQVFHPTVLEHTSERWRAKDEDDASPVPPTVPPTGGMPATAGRGVGRT